VQKEHRRRDKKKRTFRPILTGVILTFLFLALTLIMIPDPETGGTMAERLYSSIRLILDREAHLDEFPIDTYPDSRFAFHRGGVAVAGQTGFSLYNASGSRVYTQAGLFQELNLQPAGAYLLVFDRGGTMLTLLHGAREVYVGDWDEPIQTAKAGERGHLLILSRRRLALLSPQQILRYSYHMPRSEPIDAALSPSGDRIALATAQQDGMVLSSSVLLIDPAQEEPIAVVVLGDTVPLAVMGAPGGGFCILTEDSAWFLTRDGAVQSVYPYEGRHLIACTRFGDRGVLLCFSHSAAGRIEIGLLTLDGRYAPLLLSDEDILGLQAAGDRFLVRFPGRSEVYDAVGRQLARYPETEGARAVHLGDDGSLLAVFATTAVRIG
jgi:hypothetical protein